MFVVQGAVALTVSGLSEAEIRWRMSGCEFEPVSERRRRNIAFDALAKERQIERQTNSNSPATTDEADDLVRPRGRAGRPSG